MLIAGLRFVLYDDHNILHSVTLAPLVTYLIIGGALWSVLRAPFDLVLLLLATRRRPPRP